MPGSSVDHSLYFARNWVGFFLLGVTNTLPYAMVTTAANSIADSWKRPQFVPTVYGAAGSATIIAKTVNAVLVNKVHYGWRFLVNSCFLVIGCVVIAMAGNFRAAIFGIVVVGAGNAFGENIALGYLSGQGFDDDLVNAWASGTGLAGLLGACIYVLAGCIFFENDGNVDEMQYLNEWAFLIITPTVFIYLLSFMKIIIPPSDEVIRSNGIQHSIANRTSTTTYPGLQTDDDETNPLLAESTETTESEDLSVLLRSRNYGLWGKRIGAALCVVLPLAINLGLSTFFAFVSRVAASKALTPDQYNKNCPEVFAALQLCYQAGLFVSQSSLQLVKFKYPYHLTALQFLITVVWITNEPLKFLPVYMLPALMIVVGLLNGTVYVNTFYLIQTKEIFGPPNDRELCTNIAAIFINIGISCCCILQTVLDNTAFMPF
ncbi:battenin-like [Apostichopus japonicus]|uniref:battenin-like n=1 Tax=Stichopus japonicus TaxID=307972 RepID=UPI003AB64E38